MPKPLHASVFHALAALTTLATLALCVACASPAPVNEEENADAAPVNCTPGFAECSAPAAFRVCNAEGNGFEVVQCDGTQRCLAGQCREEGDGINSVTPNNSTNTGTNNVNNNTGTNNQNNNTGTNNTNNAGTNNTNNVNNNTGTNNQNNNTGTNNTNNNSMMTDDSGPCAPLGRECLSETLYRICRTDGSRWDRATCQAENPCVDGFCSGVGTPGTCTPNVTECLNSGAVRQCRPDGGGWDDYPCEVGLFCDAGTCRDLSGCTDGDGDGYGEGDCLGADCDDTNADINPADGREVCNNGVDEDCDGIDPPCDCNPLTQDCPGETLKCDYDYTAEPVTLSCVPDGDVPTGGACNGGSLQCQAGDVCLANADQTAAECITLCDFGTGAGCPDSPDVACANAIEDDDLGLLGICIESPATECDAVDEPTCAAGEHCYPLNNLEALCVTGGGDIADGELCNPNNDTCVSGTFCVSFGSFAECRGLCHVSDGDAGCANKVGTVCQPVDFGGTIEGYEVVVDAYGVCAGAP